MDPFRPGDDGAGGVVRGDRSDSPRLPGGRARGDPGGQAVSTTRVQVVPNGPVLVSGPARIEMPDGAVVESDRFMVAICTCRRSQEYPLCDTSHRRCRRVKAQQSA
ncbi:CDGSH iron-sulfur domain-containing protein [Mycobacterium kubicae]|uniref:CDGSH iron-sulfur domain-containing protein n=1 Tax=Mycobacterium kubicae TaxID=120959 RepID=A0AAX1J8F3_9MYCO|nr:CDGSH iron-sulfur domain-containing protein [Mycobacterium kubicae]QNI14230.1 CDGSH iron-sulfur domain-containing protein [Mycobacterium kubicae]QPI37744.1 CDGSH iron-sulfur domain-containing protein [Mycobacterium kubicae]